MGVRGRELLFSAVSLRKGFTKEGKILDGLIFNYLEICGTFRLYEESDMTKWSCIKEQGDTSLRPSLAFPSPT